MIGLQGLLLKDGVRLYFVLYGRVGGLAGFLDYCTMNEI